ncbi:hypothetical protein SPHI_19500 [Sphingomonas jeddahensis]|uniref:Uncharacterized protein n=2 Tax=Sphingomonas jeddahensis TaxID=1915074 RepID=A0A1V2EU93_9SPHN|nr:hypothetical protein SPHI_19500 [Sphingomonas jeddahensis]
MAIGRLMLASTMLVIAGTVSPVQAQDGLLVQPPIMQDVDRDRNVSVQSRPRPSYAPLGGRLGGLMIFPQLRTTAGASSNVYLTPRSQVGAPFAALEPSLRVQSLWSRHSLRLDAAALLRSFAGEPRRNERTWDIGGSGRLDLGRALTIIGEARASRGAENLFSGEVGSDVAALSRFRRDAAAVRAQYTSGRIRAFVAADRARFRFAPLELVDGTVRDQAARDREVTRLVGQFEHARTPSVSLFGQIGVTDTTYGRPALNSHAIRAALGFNADIAGRARGTLTVGYTIRDYRMASIAPVRGAIVEGRGELFLTRRFTVTAAARRTAEESAADRAVPQPFWDNRVTLGGDYEALANLILSASGDYGWQAVIGTNRQNRTYRLAAAARYLVSRRATLTAGMSYARRHARDGPLRNYAGEGRIEAGLAYHL